MEKIEVINNILIKIGTQEFLLTKEEAEDLFEKLRTALNRGYFMTIKGGVSDFDLFDPLKKEN